MKVTRLLVVGSCLLLIVIQTGCSPRSQPPEEVLTRALSGMAGKDQFTFRGIGEIKVGERQLKTKTIRFEGEVRNHRSTSMKMSRQNYVVMTTSRWNPVKLLSDIRTSHKKVTYLEQAAQGKEEQIPLRVELEATEAKRIFTERMLKEYDETVLPSQAWSLGKEGRSESEQQALKSLLYVKSDDYRSEYVRLLQKADVRAVYHIWVDHRSQLPQRLEGQMDIIYEEEGIPYMEAVRTVSEFTQFR